MAFRRGIARASRFAGELAGKLSSPRPPPPRGPHLSFLGEHTPCPPPSHAPPHHRLAPAPASASAPAPAVRTFRVPDPLQRACGSIQGPAPRLEISDALVRRLRAAGPGRSGCSKVEGASGSSRVALPGRDGVDGGIILSASSRTICDGTLRFDPPRREGVGLLGVIWRGAAQGAGERRVDPLHHGFTETEPCGGGLPQGRPPLCFSCEQSSFAAASSPSRHQLAATTNWFHSVLQRVSARNQGPGFTAHEGAVWSSRAPLPERDGVAGVSAEADLLDAGSLRTCSVGVASSAHHHHPAQAIRTTSYQYNQRRSMSSGSGRGGHAPPPQGPYWKNGRIILKRPTFLPIHVPDRQASLKNWGFIEEVTGMVQETCLDATDLYIKFNPVHYLKDHPLLEEVPILGDPDGTCAWKFTEDGKYSTKSLIDLIGTFHDIGCCIPSLSSNSVVINSAGKFELIEAKTEFTDLTPEGARKDYRNAVSLIEELIVASMGKQMLSLIPEDICILFSFMMIDGYWYHHLIANHVSLLPLENRSAVFLAFFDYITLCIPNVNRKLKDKVKPYIPYRKLWGIMASNNWYLVEWLKYQDYKANKQFWGSQYELLKFVRNVIAHKLALLAKGETYEAEEVENMLQALYPRLLPYIQLFFWKENLLEEFNLQSYFMDRKVTLDWPQRLKRCHSK